MVTKVETNYEMTYAEIKAILSMVLRVVSQQIISSEILFGRRSTTIMACLNIIQDWYSLGYSESYRLTKPFDGDTLNIIYNPFKEYWEKALAVFNPRDAMMISRNDGMFNNRTNVFKDVLINVNGLMRLGRSAYTEDELAKIKAITNSK